MPRTLFDVPVIISGLQHHQVLADGPEEAAAIVLASDPAIFAAARIQDVSASMVLTPRLVAEADPPDHATLLRHGTMTGSRVGRQEFLLRDQAYIAEWRTAPGTPRWEVRPAEATLSAGEDPV